MMYKKMLTAALCLSMMFGSMPVQECVAADDTAVNVSGDVNSDGKFGVADLVMMNGYLLGSGKLKNTSEADLNGDGRADVFDLLMMRRKLVEQGIDVSPYFSRKLSAQITADRETDGKAADEEFVSGQMKFALDVFRHEYNEERNTLVSPYSIMQALAMTTNGADGMTKTEMETVMGMDIERLNEYLCAQRNSQMDKKWAKLSTANSVWMRDGIYIREEFLNDAVSYYDADVFSAPFDMTTVDDINKWVDEKTDGMIPKMIDGNIPNVDIMHLINAVAFDAEWEEQFDGFNTRVSDFTSIDGQKQETEMMFVLDRNYISGEDCEGIYKYYRDRKYAFAAILPDEDTTLTQFVEQLSPEKLSGLLNNVTNAQTEIYLPKFSFDFSAILNETLIDMGMPSAFTFGTADFSKLGDHDAYIGSVIHKTFIEVGEKGTRAAGATDIGLATGDMPEPEIRHTVRFDRPFLYCIVDTETNLPIFIGTLTKSTLK